MKTAVTKVTLQRDEGRVGVDDFQPHTFPSLAQADLCLMCWARTAPENGGYHKVGFTVHWADGETYKGRFDLQRVHLRGASIGVHIWDVCMVASGRLRPGWMSDELWAGFLATVEREPWRKEWGEIPDKYDLAI